MQICVYLLRAAQLMQLFIFVVHVSEFSLVCLCAGYLIGYKNADNRVWILVQIELGTPF